MPNSNRKYSNYLIYSNIYIIYMIFICSKLKILSSICSMNDREPNVTATWHLFSQAIKTSSGVCKASDPPSPCTCHTFEDKQLRVQPTLLRGAKIFSASCRTSSPSARTTRSLTSGSTRSPAVVYSLRRGIWNKPVRELLSLSVYLVVYFFVYSIMCLLVYC